MLNSQRVIFHIFLWLVQSNLTNHQPGCRLALLNSHHHILLIGIMNHHTNSLNTKMPLRSLILISSYESYIIIWNPHFNIMKKGLRSMINSQTQLNSPPLGYVNST